MNKEIKRGAKAPRTITPHKGGRTETQLATMTPETKAAVSEIKEKHGLSLGDLIEWAVQNYRHEI